MIRQTKHITRYGTENIRDYAMLTLLWSTGARANEICHLKVVDFKVNKDCHGTVEIRDNGRGIKGKKSRNIPVDDICTAAMKEWLAFRAKKKLTTDKYPYMFINTVTGENLSYPWFHDLVKGYGAKVGIQTTPHAWRHSRCSYWLNVDNVPPTIVQTFMGHKHLSTTLGYAHTSFEDMARYVWKPKNDSERR
jgi:site-specific recombinase XerD